MFKVLVVDDNFEDRHGILRYIPWKNMDCETCEAENGTAGYEASLSFKPDIVITDISMPQMNGIDMSEKIRKAFPDTEFIFMSCFDEFDYALGAIRIGVAAYLLKPIEIDELTEKIKQVIEKIKERKNAAETLLSYREKAENSRIALIERFLSQCVFTSPKDIQNFNKQAAFLDIPLNSLWRMVLFQSDFEDDDENIGDSFATQLIVRDLIEHSPLNELSGYCINYDTYITVLFLPESAQSCENIFKECENFQKACLENYKKTITICIASQAHTPNELYNAFKKLRYITQRNHFCKSGSLILSENFEGDTLDFENITESDLSSRITELLAQGTAEDINSFIELNFSPEKISNEASVKALSFYIINTINIYLLERNESFANIFDNELSIWEKLINYKNVFNIKQWLKNLLNAVKIYLDEQTSQTETDFVQKIKQNIDKNYASLFSLEQIVETLYVTPSYANKLFHEKTGGTIYDYLQERRIAEAKNLLKNTHLKHYEIAERIGYQSNTYFTTAFKKSTGMSPKEYRRTLGIH